MLSGFELSVPGASGGRSVEGGGKGEKCQQDLRGQVRSERSGDIGCVCGRRKQLGQLLTFAWFAAVSVRVINLQLAGRLLSPEKFYLWLLCVHREKVRGAFHAKS